MLLEQVNKRLDTFQKKMAGSVDLKLRGEFEELKSQVNKLHNLEAEAEKLKAKLSDARVEIAMLKRMEEPESDWSPEELAAIVETSKKVEGTTVGIQLSADARTRLLAQKEQWKAETYRQIVTTAVMLGLAQLEKSEILATIDEAKA